MYMMPMRLWSVEVMYSFHNYGHALIRVGHTVEHRPLAAGALAPCGELLRRHRKYVELHAGEAVAAEMRRTAGKDAFPVRLKVQPGRHPRHGVDHRPHLRDEEDVPYRRG